MMSALTANPLPRSGRGRRAAAGEGIAEARSEPPAEQHAKLSSVGNAAPSPSALTRLDLSHMVGEVFSVLAPWLDAYGVRPGHDGVDR